MGMDSPDAADVDDAAAGLDTAAADAAEVAAAKIEAVEVASLVSDPQPTSKAMGTSWFTTLIIAALAAGASAAITFVGGVVRKSSHVFCDVIYYDPSTFHRVVSHMYVLA